MISLLDYLLIGERFHHLEWVFLY